MNIFTSLKMEPHSWTPAKLLVNLITTLSMFLETFSKIWEKQMISLKTI